MLRRFSVSNFKSFERRMTFDLSDPANYGFNREVVREGTKTKGMVYGANGSGKSNLALAMFDIILHLTDKEKLLQKYYPYLCLDSKKPMAEFEYEFLFDGVEVVYRYGKTDPVTLVYERLSIGGEEVLSYDFAMRKGHVSLAGAESLMLSSALPAETDKLSRVKFVRSNAILQESAATRAFISFVSFVDGMLMFYSLDERGYQGLSVGSDSFTRGIIREGKVVEFQRFLSAQGIDYELVSVDVNGLPELYCRFVETSVPFGSIASTGTKSLALYYYWFIRMSEASLVFIDEFDAFYHFELSEAIVSMLKGVEDVQVFLTTHNTDLLSNDLLRPDAYFILKDGDVRSLDKLAEKELRAAHNIQKMFKAGTFDA
ncbi:MULTISPECIES: ATP/GTP-binding protein [unclassified Adlercreutzia]|uniref:AAA family ATPase n=1 Tax=unclassified Adlercreutzia TaxID=2636013 RepID=UPI0013EBF34E|nr:MULTISPECIES: ATP-binding protein [unclassified Adlercreutzia]